MSKSMIVTPRVSEKVYGLSESLNTYVFDVPKSANKHMVADAVVAQYEVSVTKVRIANIPGKSKKSYKKRGRTIAAKRNDIRKAYVTLAEGNKLPFFAEAEAEAAAAAKADKKALKKESK